MKSEAQLAQIPVITLTIVDHRNLGFSLGASEYMTKPIDRNRLIALIQKFATSKHGGVGGLRNKNPRGNPRIARIAAAIPSAFMS